MKRFHSSLLILFTLSTVQAEGQSVRAVDPGVRANHIDSGQSLASLTSSQQMFFQDGLRRFQTVDSVSGTLAGKQTVDWVHATTQLAA